MENIDLTKIDKVERIQRPTREVFYRDFFFRSKPIIITEAMSDWRALSLWTPDYLKSVIGTVLLPIAVSSNGIFPCDPEKGWSSTCYEEMEFRNYIDLISLKNELKKTYYLQHKSIPEKFPVLANDLEYPEYFNKNNTTMNLWIGSGGNFTPIHYDFAPNFLAQVKGQKQVVLFPPTESARLYPLPLHSENANLSRVNIDKPDLQKLTA
ncbi:hypothetical protein CAL7716_066070 [Calothrix sp. PCC 7716]|nr:hypothetical protein CAL7716_066070 [Calothrix sp. PCC 7716]